MKKRTSIYASMTASDLARITRERGLDKPDVITLSEWANFLEADDAKQRQPEQAVTGDGSGRKLPELTKENTDEEKTFDPSADDDPDPEDTPPASSKPKSTKNKGS